ncbi:cuticle protein 7 [Scaptodrosophila lebanonensis]|uniref:Cuticle protein 7 n=1 Tax=Drosophila lebanonensis TaxID=7225 RepID=A0A6J2TAJ7_DROLE|nr:cuticle protein 7 [Scaptodrosophila lebanonensis]
MRGGGGKLALYLALVLVSYIAHTQCMAEYIEFYNDFAHNHDEARIKYTHQYFISDSASRVHILHREQRHGDHVSGVYSHVEPNGQVRSVHYEVRGLQGYRAIIVQRTPHSRVHQVLEFERKQPIRALPFAQPVAFVI